MSDYTHTPSTEEVKKWYVAWRSEIEGADYLDSKQEFDRWLKSVEMEAIEEFVSTGR